MTRHRVEMGWGGGGVMSPGKPSTDGSNNIKKLMQLF